MKRLFTNRSARLLIVVALLMASIVIAGCGSSTRETPGEQEAGVATIGFTECFNCHSDAQNPSGLRKPFGDLTGEGWLQSRHANFNSTPNSTSATCTICHDELGDGNLIGPFYQETGNNIFGIANRNIIGCESCHGGGGNHWGIGPLGNDFSKMSDFGVCTKCHKLSDPFHSTSPERLITDTHIDNASTPEIEGYVLNPNAKHSDLQGNTNSGTCIDCHEPHFANPEINRAWAESSHAGFIGLNNIVNSTTSPAFTTYDFKSSARAACQRCHTATGFRNRANDQAGYNPANNVFVATGEQRELIYCWACHSNNIGGIREITYAGTPGVIFPSGKIANISIPSNLCAMCHQGRESGLSVQAVINSNPSNIANKSFINIHYYAASASFLGNEVTGGYEYPSKTYVGRNTFSGHTSVDKDTCVGCHLRLNESDPPDHHFVPKVSDCSTCHTGISSFEDIRPSGIPDYDGDGNTTEGLRGEVETLEEALLTQIQTYASTVIGNAIAYDPNTYPYFFYDLNGNGSVDTNEATSANAFKKFNNTLLPAAYNYQVSKKEPCGYIHNHRYIIQLLIDSIEALGGNISSYTRP